MLVSSPKESPRPREHLPRSIPMTWPLTFSSPPSVEFHRRNAAPGILETGARGREAVRGSCRDEVSYVWPFFSFASGKTYRSSKARREHCAEKLNNTAKRERGYNLAAQSQRSETG